MTLKEEERVYEHHMAHACPHLNTTNIRYTTLLKKEKWEKGWHLTKPANFIFFISLTRFRVLNNNYTPLSEYVLKGTNSKHFY